MKAPDDEVKEAPQQPSLREASLYWLKLGFLSFGGPAGQIAMMHQDLVDKKRWISDRRFLHALNYCMVLPGPEAQQLATYIGWLMHQRRGGIIAGGLFVLPSLLILIALSWIYMQFGHTPQLTAMLGGIKPAVVAIVVFAAYRVGLRVIRNRMLFVIALLAFFAISQLAIPFPAVILLAALCGSVGHHYFPQYFNVMRAHHGASKVHAKAIIDDDTPAPLHARFSMAKTLKLAAAGVLVWLAGMLLMIWLCGWNSLLAQMGWFFTKAALLTFGGAYAVLPYLYQAAVEHYQWLTATQMIDGLALGETTPGPLIMVVAFVGFVGGWTHNFLGVDFAWLSGVLAACVVTFYTFLPSFLLIFAGAPLIESTHQNLKLTAPLTGITAAVVGVILSLAVFFAEHVFFPQGFTGGFEWFGFVLALAALWLLIKYNVSVIRLVAYCGLLGLLKYYIAL